MIRKKLKFAFVFLLLDDFEPNSNSEDDEETIAKEEGDADQTNNSDEIERLRQESLLPLDDLLKDLPEDYWNEKDKNGPNEENNLEVKLIF